MKRLLISSLILCFIAYEVTFFIKLVKATYTSDELGLTLVCTVLFGINLCIAAYHIMYSGPNFYETFFIIAGGLCVLVAYGLYSTDYHYLYVFNHQFRINNVIVMLAVGSVSMLRNILEILNKRPDKFYIDENFRNKKIFTRNRLKEKEIDSDE